MVQMTMSVSDELAERIKSMGPWLPTVLELSFIGFQTVATATATEVIRFLSKEPSPQDVLNYHVSERAQERLRRLLALNEAGMLSEAEQLELLEDHRPGVQEDDLHVEDDEEHADEVEFYRKSLMGGSNRLHPTFIRRKFFFVRVFRTKPP